MNLLRNYLEKMTKESRMSRMAMNGDVGRNAMKSSNKELQPNLLVH